MRGEAFEESLTCSADLCARSEPPSIIKTAVAVVEVLGGTSAVRVTIALGPSMLAIGRSLAFGWVCP